MSQRLVIGKAAVQYKLVWGQRTAKCLISKQTSVRQMQSLPSCIKTCSISRCGGSSMSSGRARRHISSSSRWSTEAKEADVDVVAEEEGCPEWQNPLHDEDPGKGKIMLDQFGSEETPEMVPLPPLDDGSSKVLAPPHIHELADRIVRLNMIEVKELVDRIGEHFGIDDDDMNFASGGGQEEVAKEEAQEEERTAFDLKLTGFDAKSKIKVIKEIRAITALGLKDAKALVEGVPATVKNDIKMEEAEELKAKLEAVGATVEIA